MSKYLDDLANFSRSHEVELRNHERACSDAAAEEADLQRKILTKLRELGALQISTNEGALPASVAGQLKLRKDEEQGLRDHLSGIERSISQLELRRKEFVRRIGVAEATAKSAVAASPNYSALAALLRETSETMAAVVPHMDEVLAECARKIPPFLTDRRFAYLLKAGYGTQGYAAPRLSQRLDRWLADRCQFQRNRVTFDALVALEAEAKRRRNDAQEAAALAEDQFRQLASDAMREAGVPVLESNLAETVKDIAAEKAKANSTHEKLDQYPTKSDLRYGRAIDEMASFLNEQPIAELVMQAQRTPDKQDDQLVEEIVRLNTRHDAAKSRWEKLSEELLSYRQAYQRAKEAERTLRSMSYGRRYDSDLNLNSVLTGFVLGNLTMQQVTSTVQQHQVETPPQSASDPRTWQSASSSRSSSSSGSDDSFWSGGSSRSSTSSFSSSDTFGGGSGGGSDSIFSTTDSF